MIAVPRSPEIQIAFFTMGACVFYGGFSRNVRVKRILLPVTIVLFGFVWLESMRQTFDPPTPVLDAFAVVLAVRGARAMREVRFCSDCGATLDQGKRRKKCKECSSKSSK